MPSYVITGHIKVYLVDSASVDSQLWQTRKATASFVAKLTFIEVLHILPHSSFLPTKGCSIPRNIEEL